MGPVGAEAVLRTAIDEQHLLRELQQFTADAVAADAPVDYRVTLGPVVGGIVEEARSGAADLIVLGSHGRSGFERLVLGSVTERVLRMAPCSVLTVPPASTALPAPRLFERIVAGIDFSETSTHALTFALSLAQEANAHLTVVHVVEMPHVTSGRLLHGQDQMSELARQLVDSARARLAAAVPAAARDWCDLRERLEIGRPHDEILRVADEDHAGLVVVGVHGHGVFDTLIFGSTAQHIVRRATCPVLTVRGPI
jgi:nucleotide-binding universal stress UspA family protein